MSEKRFAKLSSSIDYYLIWDTNEEKGYTEEEIVDKLNELNDENEQLRQTIEEMKSDERLYAKEIVKLNKEAKEVLNFKTLGGDY